MKLADLIKPEHVNAAYARYEDNSYDLDPHIEELKPIARVVALSCSGQEFALTMAAISIVDLAIQEATRDSALS